VRAELKESQLGLVPVPDPTVLTTQSLLREIASLRELLETRIAGVGDIFAERLGGMDKAIKLLQEYTRQLVADIDNKIENLRKLHQEKFDGIEKRFQDQKEALATALNAAKEAVGEQTKSSGAAIQKSELSTGKQIEGLDSKITDIKERIDRIEGKGEGRGSMWTYVVSAVSLLIAAGSLIFALGR